MVDIISNLYQGLTGIVSTSSWTTDPFQVEIGVFQGDPLSVPMFNTVMNMLEVAIVSSHMKLGYFFCSSPHRSVLLQYTDDTCITAYSPSSCMTILSITKTWFKWTGMKTKFPKCLSLIIQGSTGTPFEPRLSLDGDNILDLDESTFKFLGAPVNIHSANSSARESLLELLSSVMKKVDATLISRQQKLLLFKVHICLRLTWDLSVNKYSPTRLQTKL